MNGRKNRHTVSTSAQFSAYKQGLSDCEEFLSGLDREKQYSATELVDIFRERSQGHRDSVAQTPTLLRTLARYEKIKEERLYIEKLRSDILAMAEKNGIVPLWDKEKFWAKLFSIGSETTNILYGEYQIKQKNNHIKAIIYLDAPYKYYTIFAQEGNALNRYKLREDNKVRDFQNPQYRIDDYVDLRIEHKKFLDNLYKMYNTI